MLEQVILKLEEEIKKIDKISESVSFHNAGETLQYIGDDVDKFLILQSARLSYILSELENEK